MATQTITYGPADTSLSQFGWAWKFIVPAGVTSVTVDAQGAQGGGVVGALGGKGGRVQATLSVTPGDTLLINVGTKPTDDSLNYLSYGGGGGYSYSGSATGLGGGASDIRTSGGALADRIIVAGGGGGAGRNAAYAGGAGGGLTGGTGSGGGPGTGGSQAAGGTTGGALGLGGSTNAPAAGAGGGGYYGGGYGTAGGGGGGSSYTHATLASSVTHTQGYRSGNGQVLLTFTVDGGLAPTLTTRPLIRAVKRTTLAMVDGQFYGEGITYSYQWERSTDQGANWSNATGTGATTSTYSYSDSTDGECYLRLAVTATNAYGAKTVRSGHIACFPHTGASSSLTIPNLVTSVEVAAFGAAGGMGNTAYASNTAGGKGGLVRCDLSVSAGETLTLRAGGVGENSGGTNIGGAGGYNGGGASTVNGSRGGGGGGASDIRSGGDALANRILVAGGGGGGRRITTTTLVRGGAGGGLTGGTPENISGTITGGTQSAGGTTGGSLGTGGSTSRSDSGGGGGGYYGGGAANSTSTGGGGGGSSYADATRASNVTHTQGDTLATSSGALFLTIIEPLGTVFKGFGSATAAGDVNAKGGLRARGYASVIATVTFLAYTDNLYRAWSSLTVDADVEGQGAVTYSGAGSPTVSVALSGAGHLTLGGAGNLTMDADLDVRHWAPIPVGGEHQVGVYSQLSPVPLRQGGRVPVAIPTRQTGAPTTRERLGE